MYVDPIVLWTYKLKNVFPELLASFNTSNNNTEVQDDDDDDYDEEVVFDFNAESDDEDEAEKVEPENTGSTIQDTEALIQRRSLRLATAALGSGFTASGRRFSHRLAKS